MAEILLACLDAMRAARVQEIAVGEKRFPEFPSGVCLVFTMPNASNSFYRMNDVVHLGRCFTVWAMLGCFSCALLLVSCGKQDSAGSSATPAKGVPSSDAPVVAVPGPGEKICFGCNGDGMVTCHAQGCRKGKVDCPGNCLKLTKGNWKHMEMAGHSPNDLWISFRGKTRTRSWNQGHVGEVIVFKNGEAENIGPCPVCGGATTVTCAACKGQGIQKCEICSGKKFIPAAWTQTDNPWFNSQPDLIRLKDGQAILGRVAASSGEDRTIVTRDKKILRVNASDIVPK